MFFLLGVLTGVFYDALSTDKLKALPRNITASQEQTLQLILPEWQGFKTLVTGLYWSYTKFEIRYVKCCGLKARGCIHNTKFFCNL